MPGGGGGFETRGYATGTQPITKPTANIWHSSKTNKQTDTKFQ